MGEPKSQNEIILEHLKSGKSITPAEALNLCGSLALHSRIAELRAGGHRIRTEIVTSGRRRFGRYSLEARP